jgi:hypothetical protein
VSTQGTASDFHLVEDPLEALELLTEGARTLASAFMWTKGREVHLQSHLQVFEPRDGILFFTTPAHFDVSTFQAELIKQETSECLFSLSLPSANIFFKAAFLGMDGGGLKFKRPKEVYKVQRRKTMRLTLPEGTLIRIDFKDPSFPEKRMQRKVLDISAGGAGIEVSPTDKALFPVGSFLEDFNVSVKGRLIKGRAEVLHLKGSKLGVLFHGLKVADEQWIASYVFEETRKIFQRFME